MARIAVRVDDYHLRPAENKQFQAVVDKMIDMGLPVTLSVVPHQFPADDAAMRYLCQLKMQSHCEIALHGWKHGVFGRPYEFEGSYEAQRDVILRGLQSLADYLAPITTVVPPFYRANETTLQVLNDLAGAQKREFVLSSYLGFEPRGCSWQNNIFVLNSAVDVISNWRQHPRPMKQMDTILSQLHEDTALVIHPGEHLETSRKQELLATLSTLSMTGHTFMTCSELAQSYKAQSKVHHA